jgi:hypothetical protein
VATTLELLGAKTKITHASRRDRAPQLAQSQSQSYPRSGGGGGGGGGGSAALPVVFAKLHANTPLAAGVEEV